MRAVNLATLRRRVRRRSDAGGDLRRFPDSEVDDCINEGIAQFHSEIVRASGQGFEEAEFSFVTVSGTNVYPLPAEFLQVRAVRLIEGDRVRSLRVFSEWDVDILKNTDLWINAGVAFYRLLGSNIELEPMPKSAVTCTVKYVNTAVKLVSDLNAIDGINGFEEFVVLWAAEVICTQNNEQDRVQLMMARRQEILDRMVAIINNRNDAEPPTVGDAARRLYRPYRWGPYGGSR